MRSAEVASCPWNRLLEWPPGLECRQLTTAVLHRRIRPPWDPQAGELLLTTPLGSTLATITWGQTLLKMTQGSQITQRRSLAELSADMGGTEVPVAALFAWLKGEPALVTGFKPT
ncbi:MAG: lipoprotein insertase outer membrane protein LolB [Burkholderiaceae bacterium]